MGAWELDGHHRFVTPHRVNLTECIFDDDDDDDPQDTDEYEVEVHDIDTDLGTLMAFQHDTVNLPGANSKPNGNRFRKKANSNGSRRVHMNLATWKKLSQKDQNAWDVISDNGKTIILDYNVEKTKRMTDANPISRSVNKHEGIVFDENEGAPEDSKPEIQVSVTQQGAPRSLNNTDIKPHPANASKGNGSRPDKDGIDIRNMMSIPMKGKRVMFRESQMWQVTVAESLLPENMSKLEDSGFPPEDTIQYLGNNTEHVNVREVNMHNVFNFDMI